VWFANGDEFQHLSSSQITTVVRSLNRMLVCLTDLRTQLDLQDRSKDRLLVVGIFPGRHQAEVMVWVEVVVCTGLHRAAMLVGRETGHWAKDCPKRPPGNQAVTGTVSSCAVNRVHVMAEIQGKPICCLLDSGCNRSVIGRSCVPSAKLNPSTFELFTANKAPLTVFGDLNLAFTVDGHPMEASVSVSPDIEGLLLGSD